MEQILEQNYNFYLETNLDKYTGEWIAIFENEVISHGKDLKEVVKIAKQKSGNKNFMLARVPSEETMIF